MKPIDFKSFTSKKNFPRLGILKSISRNIYLIGSLLVLCVIQGITGCGRVDQTSDVKSENFDAVLLGGTVERVKRSELAVFAAGGDLPQLSSRVNEETVKKFRIFMLRDIPIPPPTAQNQAAQAKLSELILTMSKIVRDFDSRTKIEKTILADAKTNASKASLYRILIAYPTPLMQIDLAVFALSWKKMERLANELDQEYLQGF